MKLLNVKELAEKLGVPVSWIYDRTRKSGPESLPHIRVGKYIRFQEAEVLEYLKNKAAEENPTTC